LLCLTIILAGASLIFEERWAPTPAQLTPLMPWKDLIVAALLALGWLLLMSQYFSAHNDIMLAMTLAVRLQLLATLASFAVFWLEWRKKYNLPVPKCEFRW